MYSASGNNNYSDHPSDMYVSYSYNSSNQLYRISSFTTNYTFGYDLFGNITDVAAGSFDIVSYEYNENNGKLCKTVYSNGWEIEYIYNDLELLSEVCYNNGTRTTAYQYEYTSDGQVSKYIDLINGKTTVYSYDSKGRVITSKEYDTSSKNDSVQVTMDYADKEDRLSVWNTVCDTAGNYYTELNDYYYDARSNVKMTVSESDRTFTVTNYSYDGYNRLTSTLFEAEDLHNGNEFGFSTRADITYYAMDEYGSNNVATYTVTTNTNTPLVAYITHDAFGNITKITYSNGEEVRYYYNDLGQLIREDNTMLNETLIYRYDDCGNITFRADCYLTPEGQAPQDDNGNCLEYSDDDWGDRLLKFNSHTITYDAMGNPLIYYNGQSYTFTWNGRQLSGATVSGKNMSFAYNAEGIRTSKTVNDVTTTYYLSGSQIIGEETNGDIILYTYDAYGSPVGFRYRGADYYDDEWDIYWYEKNLFGDIVGVYNNDDYKLITYEYDAWGNVLVAYHNNGEYTSAVNNPFLYRGYYYDSETGLYYVSSRYYDPEIGRWINADSQLNTSLGVLGCNMFAYCLNNPVNKVDYGGNKPGDLFDTMDEAAKDAAEYLGELTWENTWEYSTAIYTVNTTIKTYETVTKTHRFLWWTWTTTSTKTVRTKVTKYTYKAVKTDKKNNSVGVPNAPLFKKRVAALHTHPMGSWAGITRFSDADKKWADYYKIPLYVHGPNGELRKYDPATGEDILIYSDLPISPKTPWLE